MVGNTLTNTVLLEVIKTQENQQNYYMHES